jgi:uncharacterized SAM-binding protein YcdF (DUF218 family)
MEDGFSRQIAEKWKRAGKKAWRVLHGVLVASGVFFLAFCAFLCTDWPQRFLNWMAHAANPAGSPEEANVIFVPSGAGMPSESALMRLWMAGEAARRAPRAQVALALPAEAGQVEAYRDELVLRGVAPERIKVVTGRNTREQAVELAEAIPAWDAAGVRILVVTSPAHVRRTAAAVRMVLGRAKVCALPAWNGDFESNLSFADDAAGEPREEAGAVAEKELFLRYGLERNARAFLDAAREWVALLWYRIMRWA